MKYMAQVNWQRWQALLLEEDGFLTEVKFVKDENEILEFINDNEIRPGDGEILREAKMQFEEYFDERRKTFELPMKPAGTPFQKAVWEELKKIPYGEYRSYRQIAEAVGSPKAARAVGQAVHVNPLPIVIPCHRVICSDGHLGGYGGGQDMKYFLLMMEGAI